MNRAPSLFGVPETEDSEITSLLMLPETGVLEPALTLWCF